MKRAICFSIFLCLTGLTSIASAASTKIKYPELVISGIPEAVIFISDMDVYNISDGSALNRQLKSPKSVSKIVISKSDNVSNKPSEVSNEYFLDNKGSVKRELTYYDSILSSNVEFSYDTAGNLIGQKYIPSNESYVYRYVALEGGLTAREFLDKYDIIKHRLIFDQNGNVTQYDREHDEAFIKLKYDDNGRMIEISSRITPGMICISNPQSNCPLYVINVEYPSEGVIVTHPQKNPSKGAVIRISKDTINWKGYLEAATPLEMNTSFTYDKRGNWIEMVEEGNKGYKSITRRKIVYR